MLNQEEAFDLNVFLNFNQYLNLVTDESVKHRLIEQLTQWTEVAFSQGKTIDKLNFRLALDEDGLEIEKVKKKDNIEVIDDHVILFVEKDLHDGIESNIEVFINEVNKEVKELYTFH